MDDNNSKKAAKETIIAALEIIDSKIPVIGPFMDMPFIDRLEQDLVGVVVDSVWDADYTRVLETDMFVWSA